MEGGVLDRAVAPELHVAALGVDLPGKPLARLAAAGREARVADAERVLARADQLPRTHVKAAAARVDRALVEHALQRVDVEDHELGLELVRPIEELDLTLGDADPRRGREGKPAGLEVPLPLDHANPAFRDGEILLAVVADVISRDLEGFVESILGGGRGQAHGEPDQSEEHESEPEYGGRSRHAPP